MMIKKYLKMMGEKILVTIKKIAEIKMESKVDVLLDNFEKIVTEVELLDIAGNLKHALGLQFLERLEVVGKINGGEKLRMRDVLENVDEKRRAGKILESMKELKNQKVIKNKDKPFKKQKKE